MAGPAKATISITGEDPTVSRTLQVLLSSLGYTVTLSRDPTAAPPNDAQLILVVPGSANWTHETLVGRLEKTAALAALPLLFLTTPGDRKDTQRNTTIRYVPWPCHLKTLQCEIESALQSVVDENL